MPEINAESIKNIKIEERGIIKKRCINIKGANNKNYKYPDRMEFKVHGRRMLYKRHSVHRDKRVALDIAKEVRKEGFKARVKRIKNKHAVYYFN